MLDVQGSRLAAHNPVFKHEDTRGTSFHSGRGEISMISFLRVVLDVVQHVVGTKMKSWTGLVDPNTQHSEDLLRNPGGSRLYRDWGHRIKEALFQTSIWLQLYKELQRCVVLVIYATDGSCERQCPSAGEVLSWLVWLRMIYCR